MNTSKADYFDISNFLNTEHEYDHFETFSRSMPMVPNYDEPGTANCIQFQIPTGDQQ